MATTSTPNRAPVPPATPITNTRPKRKSNPGATVCVFEQSVKNAIEVADTPITAPPGIETGAALLTDLTVSIYIYIYTHTLTLSLIRFSLNQLRCQLLELWRRDKGLTKPTRLQQ